MIEPIRIALTVNGRALDVEVEGRITLADFLREGLGLTGTHLGCEHGACGSCTVLVDGQSVRSCVVLAWQVSGAEVTTIEGLGEAGVPHPLQVAFRDQHALQCGYCTPGMIMSLLPAVEDPKADEDALTDAISGNLCRCTGYWNIMKAARAARSTIQADRAATKR